MLLRSVRLRSLLSFNDASLELGPLNVLIGPNASGKSNFIEAISLLQSSPRGLSLAMKRGDGVRGWIWKGYQLFDIAEVACVVEARRTKLPLRYCLKFSEKDQNLFINEERLEAASVSAEHPHPPPYFDREGGNVVLRRRLAETFLKADQMIVRIGSSESVLSVIKHPVESPEITSLGRRFDEIRIHREFQTGALAGARNGTVSSGASADWLDDRGDNLALVLNRMTWDGSIRRVNEYLKRFCERFHEVAVKIDGGIVQTYIRENGLPEPLSAIRLSDGTLKFLCLLAVLLPPRPPELVCIEEPELGLHPDALPLVAEALVEASERMQLIVTTHSEALIDALSDKPEAVVVCSHTPETGTQFKRLNREELSAWLEDYTLGDLWRKGEIGGKRS